MCIGTFASIIKRFRSRLRFSLEVKSVATGTTTADPSLSAFFILMEFSQLHRTLNSSLKGKKISVKRINQSLSYTKRLGLQAPLVFRCAYKYIDSARTLCRTFLLIMVDVFVPFIEAGEAVRGSHVESAIESETGLKGLIEESTKSSLFNCHR